MRLKHSKVSSRRIDLLVPREWTQRVLRGAAWPRGTHSAALISPSMSRWFSISPASSSSAASTLAS
jgi:hypothetical protein